jgi:hypothetical protein
MTPEALAAFQKAEIEKWWLVIKAANTIEAGAGISAPVPLDI